MCLLAPTIIFISAAECKMNPTVRLPIFPQFKKKSYKYVSYNCTTLQIKSFTHEDLHKVIRCARRP